MMMEDGFNKVYSDEQACFCILTDMLYILDKDTLKNFLPELIQVISTDSSMKILYPVYTIRLGVAGLNGPQDDAQKIKTRLVNRKDKFGLWYIYHLQKCTRCIHVMADPSTLKHFLGFGLSMERSEMVMGAEEIILIRICRSKLRKTELGRPTELIWDTTAEAIEKFAKLKLAIRNGDRETVLPRFTMEEKPEATMEVIHNKTQGYQKIKELITRTLEQIKEKTYGNGENLIPECRVYVYNRNPHGKKEELSKMQKVAMDIFQRQQKNLILPDHLKVTRTSILGQTGRSDVTAKKSIDVQSGISLLEKSSKKKLNSQNLPIKERNEKKSELSYETGSMCYPGKPPLSTKDTNCGVKPIPGNSKFPLSSSFYASVSRSVCSSSLGKDTFPTTSQNNDQITSSERLRLKRSNDTSLNSDSPSKSLKICCRVEGDIPSLATQTSHEEVEKQVETHPKSKEVLPKQKFILKDQAVLQKHIVELEFQVEDERKRAQKAENAFSCIRQKMHQMEKKMEQKTKTLTEINSGTHSKLEAAEQRNRHLLEILERKSTELVEMKNLKTEQNNTNKSQKSISSNFQKRINLVIQQRDFYKKQLDEYEKDMQMSSNCEI